MRSSYHLDHLQHLETEAIHIMREVAAEFERPCILFSGGKAAAIIGSRSKEAIKDKINFSKVSDEKVKQNC